MIYLLVYPSHLSRCFINRLLKRVLLAYKKYIYKKIPRSMSPILTIIGENKSLLIVDIRECCLYISGRFSYNKNSNDLRQCINEWAGRIKEVR